MEKLLITSMSSLEKIFPDDDKTRAGGYHNASALRNELFSYQLVINRSGWGLGEFEWEISCPEGLDVTVFKVENVPCELAAYPSDDHHDDGYITLKSGVFPDVLRPVADSKITLSGFQNTVLWIDVKVAPDCPAGRKEIVFTVRGNEAEAESIFTLDVIPAELPEQELLFTQWFHVDCLADYYGVEIYSDEHRRIIENFMRCAARHGINTILTPVLTPALDTAIGTDRPCTQLVKIRKNGDKYDFDTTLLKWYVDTALKCGMTHFEISHLYSQWGARFAPNIYAEVNGENRRIFGWETPADSEEYTDFLKQLLPAVVSFFENEGLIDKVLFHISDEPSKDHIETYKKRVELVRSIIGDLPIIDALSSPEFYDMGLVKRPVSAIDHITPFIERNVPDLWAYNCCGQCKNVSNRFLAMPSCRNRIIGLQLYKFGIKGFLHWGYNFWNSQESRYRIDPFKTTDGGGAFPGGDPFSVYPAPDGSPLPSLRLKTFFHGLQDMRAFKLLEELKGREAAEEAIISFKVITFDTYPVSPQYILDVREKVNSIIKNSL